MSVGPGSDPNVVSRLPRMRSCNIAICRSVQIPRKCQQEACTVSDGCFTDCLVICETRAGRQCLDGIDRAEITDSQKCRVRIKREINTHGCCGYTVITLRLLETPRMLFTRPDTKKVQPFFSKFIECALRAPLSSVSFCG